MPLACGAWLAGEITGLLTAVAIVVTLPAQPSWLCHRQILAYALAAAASTGTAEAFFFFQSPMAARMASSASTEQWIFTGGSESSRTMSVFLMARASSTFLPLIHSVASDELAMAEPQPKVLNLASSMT